MRSRPAASRSTASSPSATSRARFVFRWSSTAPLRTRGATPVRGSRHPRSSTATTSGSPGTRCSRAAGSSALALGALPAFMVGLRRLGLDRANLVAWREFLAVSGAALLFGMLEYAMNLGGSREAFGLVLAALGEELVYRLAVLIIVGAVC